MIKKFIFLSLIIITINAFSFTYENPNKSIDIKNTLEKAESLGLGISKIEESKIDSLRQIKKNKPEVYNEIVANKESSLALEIETNTSIEKINSAKTIAKYELYKAVEANWKDLKETVLNDSAEADFESFKYPLIKKLDEIAFITYKSKTVFVFECSDWGQVRISTNLKRASVILKVSSHLDNIIKSKKKAPRGPKGPYG